jgi:hypothetical protein
MIGAVAATLIMQDSELKLELELGTGCGEAPNSTTLIKYSRRLRIWLCEK